ncbi:TetR/AcrR family transcriptional regulator [Streptomyces sp. SDr-06]|uniref:TetR/AcrR family transcriptional regulator n=1 Tax=Streptomyces sp. SDr-06 TaxID=2267702 RepID=UPI000DE9CE6D|nr:TetR/AcrR family transcriptional regulator [Streptomyces sp. SDr-06]RCH59653.1 TetR/AcrR family transcriptional regulator [Streptomyces sp. SDr-06]
MTAAQAGSGRTNQKQRTRMAIVAAARKLIGTGEEVAMPLIAEAALVSEATAYRYFPDLPSLISEALAGDWPPPHEALTPVAESTDPVERTAFACEFLLRGILARQGAVRAMIAATVTRPESVRSRPGVRFGLIDHALQPLESTLGKTDPQAFAQLKRGLAVVVSAEALFTLTDLCGLPPDEAVDSAVRTATTLTRAALRRTE